MYEDGYRIVSAESYKDDTKTQNLVRENSKSIPDIKLNGDYKNEKEDNALFEEIIRHCSQTTVSLKFYCMNLNLPVENLKVFPFINKTGVRIVQNRRRHHTSIQRMVPKCYGDPIQRRRSNGRRYISHIH